MPNRRDDGVSWRSLGSGGRSVALAGGLVLAVVACAVSFLTDDARYLRLAVMAAAWAFVAAAFVAGRRRSEQQAASGRADELRRAYERELDTEAAARREFELELENDLRRQAEEAMRGELAVLREELGELFRVRDQLAQLADVRAGLDALSGLRADLAGVSALRSDVEALAALRSDVATLAGLRGEVAALAALRDDLGQLGELRADVGRLRAEVQEQLNGEMLVERIVMRTQATRWPADQGAALRLDVPPTIGREVPATDGTGPRTAAFSLEAPLLPPVPAPAPSRSPLEWLAERALVDPDFPARSRHAAAEPSLADRPSPEPMVAPVALPDPATAETPAVDRSRPVPHRRRRTDDSAPELRPDPAEAVTTERPSVVPDAAPAEVRAQEPVREPAAPDGHVRVAEILAENGISPAGTPRRRRRYRDENEPDDVLARVLGRN